MSKKKLGSLNDLIINTCCQHDCTKLPNLEMEPKCLTKSDVQLIPDISRTKNDKRILKKALKQLMSRDCNDESCF